MLGKRILIAGGALITSLAVGVVMLQLRGAPQRLARAPVVATDAVVRAENVVVAGVPASGALSTAPAPPAPIGENQTPTLALRLPQVTPPAEIPRRAPRPTIPRPAAFTAPGGPAVRMQDPAPAAGCTPEMRAEGRAAAMVRLTISAPCYPETSFTLHHSGMMVTDRTDVAGGAILEVPALAERAVFLVDFGSAAGAVSTARVTSLDLYDRKVVQWRGRSGLHMHAMEYGADYGSEGHVWAGAGRDPAAAAKGEGGFLVTLGVPEARQAEIYTFPAATAKRGGSVEIRIEAEVTSRTCGRDVEAQGIEIRGGGQPVVREVVLAMPACGEAGEASYLLLKNLFDDLKITRN